MKATQPTSDVLIPDQMIEDLGHLLDDEDESSLRHDAPNITRRQVSAAMLVLVVIMIAAVVAPSVAVRAVIVAAALYVGLVAWMVAIMSGNKSR